MSTSRTRDSARSAIKRYQKASMEDTDKLGKEQISTYLDLLHQQWKRFNDAQEQLEMACGDDAAAIEESERMQTEIWYVNAKANFQRLLSELEQLHSPQANTTNQSHSLITPQVKLPIFELPRFDGKPTTWMSFYDSFKAIVHDQNNLTGSQKLHYLRSCLSDEPLQLISNFKLQDANYLDAWSLLKTRYHVRRVIIDNHFAAIFAVGKANADTSQAIKSVLDPIIRNVRALRVFALPTEYWDDWLVHIITHRLAHETRRHWELSLNEDIRPTLDQLQTFLESRCRSLEMLSSVTDTPPARNGATTQQRPRSSCNTSQDTQASPSACFCCSGNHKIHNCADFLRNTLQQRMDIVRNKNACFNCLSLLHRVKDCKSTTTCKVCSRRHHTLLHAKVNATESEIMSQPNSTPTTASHHANDSTVVSTAPVDVTVLLSTALVSIQDSNGKHHTIRALLDSGSHSSFISESCVQKLRLQRRHKNVLVTGIGGSKSHIKGEVHLKFNSINTKNTFSLSALILPKLTSYIPSEKVVAQDWPHLVGLELADSEYATPSRIDLLIGAGELATILEPEIIRGPSGTPTAQKTALGWVLFGKLYANRQLYSSSCLHADIELTELVRKVWDLDDYKEKSFPTQEETLCEQHFNTTHQRDAQGRFIVTLPFKANFTLGQSRDIAIKSWLRMEKRLNANEELHKQYNRFLIEMLEQGHMRPADALTDKCYYMPHHCVIKNFSTTTKIRVVFNASQKTSNGISLNDALMVGPTLQQDLASILIRFQTHCYALTADIAAMYRQVKVCEEHTNYQRIIWRRNKYEPLQDFCMSRVTYGIASSAHHAVRALQETARSDNTAHPNVVTAILHDFYMDDLLTGADTEKNLDALRKGIDKTLKHGCFELLKWASNSEYVLGNIPKDIKENTISLLIAEDDNVRVLGLIWDSSNDQLFFDVNLPDPPHVFTKRTLLSDSCRLFDPTGKLAPITLVPKALFQRIWQTGINWDDPVPENLVTYWIEHRKDLKALKQLRIPRWLGTRIENTTTDLHCFADASEIAYAAVIYARTEHSDGSVVVRLINAKTKVAPLRTISISRLELCASTLAAELASYTMESLCLPVRKVYGWTDSMNALAWLRSHPSRWKVFVANRVSKAQSIIASDYWNHVASEHNPADCASRGMCASKLLKFDLWWNGPSWLQKPEADWPEFIPAIPTDLELRPQRVLTHTATNGKDFTSDVISSFSSFSRLKRITAYCFRFYENCKRKRFRLAPLSGPLSSHELQSTQEFWIKAVQRITYKEEIACCLSSKAIPLRSPVARLNAFVDRNGLLRVGGRIKHSSLSLDSKFPIILPAKAPLCTLILSDLHKMLLHAGPQLMQAVLQRRYWIIGARNIIRKFYRNCVTCLRHSTNAQQQMMANLPHYRVNQARPFLHTGVDMAGPFTLKFSKGRGAKTTKGYIALFICMSTGAMHLELAGDLSTKTFIAVLKRFVARRGHCSTLVSDNGKNFVGAERELQSMFERAHADESFRCFIADRSMDWKFNPPYAPHMGGYWETAVKRVKFHLKRSLRNVLLTYEEFNTVLVEVEACVNSRPLCPLPSDVTDLEVLTPGHFLISEPLVVIPEPQDTAYHGSLLERWQLLSQIRNHFWRRWSTEYLASLQKRAKWLRPQVNLQQGDLVVVRDANAPPAKWLLGKIITCFPGDDGKVRVAQLKTAEGILTRPITKLIPIISKNATD